MRYTVQWVGSYPSVVDTIENRYAPFGCLETAESAAHDFEEKKDNPKTYEWEPLPQEEKK